MAAESPLPYVDTRPGKFVDGTISDGNFPGQGYLHSGSLLFHQPRPGNQAIIHHAVPGKFIVSRSRNPVDSLQGHSFGFPIILRSPVAGTVPHKRYAVGTYVMDITGPHQKIFIIPVHKTAVPPNLANSQERMRHPSVPRKSTAPLLKMVQSLLSRGSRFSMKVRRVPVSTRSWSATFLTGDEPSPWILTSSSRPPASSLAATRSVPCSGYR